MSIEAPKESGYYVGEMDGVTVLLWIDYEPANPEWFSQEMWVVYAFVRGGGVTALGYKMEVDFPVRRLTDDDLRRLLEEKPND